MNILFAHAGHSHDMGSMSSIDHCMPIIVGAGIIIVLLIGMIVYLLTKWHPKDHSATTKKAKAVVKK